MYRFIFFSKRKNEIINIYFADVDDMLVFIGDNYKDFDIEDHYIKITKE